MSQRQLIESLSAVYVTKCLSFRTIHSCGQFSKILPSGRLVNSMLIFSLLPILELQTIDITTLETWKSLDKLRSFCYLYFFLHIIYIWIMLTIARHALSSKTSKERAQRLKSVPLDSRSSLTTYYMKVTQTSSAHRFFIW